MNIESVPSEAGPDLGGIKQGISNDEGKGEKSLFRPMKAGFQETGSGYQGDRGQVI